MLNFSAVLFDCDGVLVDSEHISCNVLREMLEELGLKMTQREVELHFKGKTGNYMETKPLHGSQKSNWIDDNTLEITLDVIINYELERLVLSYADNVSVIEPLSLHKSIKTRLKNALEQY